MLKNLSNFASLEVTNSEEVKGGTCYIPTPCYCTCGNPKSVKTVKVKTPKPAKSVKCK